MNDSKTASQFQPLVTLFAFAIIIVSAILLRCHGLAYQSYWLHELRSMSCSAADHTSFEAVPTNTLVHHAQAHTALTAGSTWSAVFKDMRSDVHPPLYFMVLQTWRQLLGDSEFATRMLSVLCSGLAMVFIVGGAWSSRMRSDIVWLLLFWALSFCDIFMAQDVRHYSMALMFVCACCCFSMILTRQPPGKRVRWCIPLALAMYLAMLTHTLCLLVLLALGCYVVVVARNHVKQWILTAGIAAGMWAISWGPTFLAQQGNADVHASLYSQQEDPDWQSCLRFTDLPIRLLFDHQTYHTDTARSAIGLCVLLFCTYRLYKSRDNRGWLFALWYAIPVSVVFVIDLWTNREMLAHIRYVSFVVPGALGWFIWSVSSCLPIKIRTPLLLTIALGVFFTLDVPKAHKPYGREAAVLLQRVLQPTDLVIFDGVGLPSHWANRQRAVVVHYVDQPINNAIVLESAPDDELLKQIRAYDRLITVSMRHDQDVNPSDATYHSVARTEYIFGVGWITVYQRKGESVDGVP